MVNNSELRYMTDEEVESLKYRATGASTRIVDRIVQDFFNLPMGTKIYVTDHYGSKRADDYLAYRVLKRLSAEHKIWCNRRFDDKGMYIVRERPTYHELIEEELKRRNLDD